MTGTYQHTLDSKGRLFVPAKLREELGDVFYVTIAVDCLNMYSLERWTEMEERVANMPRQQRQLMRPIFANAAKCELDAQGRILLPQNLREKAGLQKNVTVVGANNHAELWSSEAWDTVYVEESMPENIAAVMEELDF